VLNSLQKINLPAEITTLLGTLSNVGFFERSTLIGSWVMPIYQELYQASYVLKTLDIDFAVHTAHARKGLRADLEQIITGIGFIDYLSASGVQKFSSGGYEVEFLVHRKGGGDSDAMAVTEWNIIAQPLPFISILIDFSEEAKLEDFVIRFPIPEAFFIHKLIIAQRRRKEAKRLKDLDQCSALVDILRDDRLFQVIQSMRLSKETRRCLRSSCDSIGFPLHMIG
jgi:hypothetical protein